MKYIYTVSFNLSTCMLNFKGVGWLLNIFCYIESNTGVYVNLYKTMLFDPRLKMYKLLIIKKKVRSLVITKWFRKVFITDCYQTMWQFYCANLNVNKPII